MAGGRIADLLLERGNARASGIAARGQGWGDLVGGGALTFANVLGQHRERQAAMAQQRAAQAKQAAAAKAFSGNTPPSVADLMASGFSAEEAIKLLGDYAKTRPEPAKPQAVDTVDEAGNPITRFVIPEAGQSFAKPKPKAGTREIKTRNADGSENVQIVEDAPGFSATSAAPPADASDYEWVTRGGQPMQIVKGTAKPGDRPYQPPSQRAPDSGEWVTTSSGEVVKRVPQAGDKPYDSVAARQQAGNVNPDEAKATAIEIQRVATDLLKSPGLSGAFGVIDSRLPTWRQSTADAEVLLGSLTGLLTLSNTGKLKGVLSNADMEVLRKASTSLAATMGDASARAELKRIIEKVSTATGIAPDFGDAGGGKVRMRAPDGRELRVPPAEVERMKSLGAKAF